MTPQPAPPRDAELLGRAAGAADRLATHLRTHVGWLSHLPQHLGDLSDVGFGSVVGTSLEALRESMTALSAGLRSWAGGDQAAAASTRAMLTTYRTELEGYLAYCQIAGDTAGRLNVLPAGMLRALRAEFDVIGRDVAGLIAALGELADLEPAGPH